MYRAVNQMGRGDELVPALTYDCSLSFNLISTRGPLQLQDNLNFYGSFRKIRELRDYSYHVNYTRSRQLWQDQARACRDTPQRITKNL